MPHDARSDRALIHGVLAGDPRAADLFVTRFTRLVWWILIHQIRLRPEPAEEVYQDVFVHLWDDDYRRLRNWSGEGDFAAYLAPIVRHRALDSLRREQGRPLHETDDRSGSDQADDRPDPHERAWIEEQRCLVDEAVAALGEPDRRLYEFLFVQERSYREVSASLGITVNHVGVRRNRLVKRLREAITAEPSRKAPETGTAVRLRGPSPSPE
jgi:RNA polymerase sigma-70 factor (ECF subfamily)